MQIKEFLPNPIGKDTDAEYVVLLNNDKITVTMTGWKITNASGKSFTLNPIPSILNPGAELKLPYSLTKLTLKNTGETISLYDFMGKLTDQLSFTGTAIEGRIITHNAELTEELKSQLFTNLPEEYPGVLHENFLNSPWVFMVLVVAAAEAAVGLGIIVALFRNKQTLYVDEVKELKG